ncbi:MAG: ABC transporter permease subunit [Lentisphaerae bacterium]|nr:ABC transporter permease subunit [Lentisphaerota bacterium]
MRPVAGPMAVAAAGALLDIRRRRDASAAGILAGAFAAGLLAARRVGFETPAAATFFLNLGLALSVFLSQLAALLLAARQLPEEMENGTLYPLLARPVRRADVLLGKWLAAWAAGAALFAATVLPVLLLVPRLEAVFAGTLLQGLCLHGLSLGFISALGMAATLWLPRAPGTLLAAALVFGAGALLRLGGRFPLFYALPDPGRLNLVARYTDGIGPLPAGDFLLLAAYALLWTGLLLGGAIGSFRRRNL